MVLKQDQERVRALLTDTISLLCKNGLKFKSEFSVEGLLGITVDNSEVFLVNIKEMVRSAVADSSSNRVMIEDEMEDERRQPRVSSSVASSSPRIAKKRKLANTTMTSLVSTKTDSTAMQGDHSYLGTAGEEGGPSSAKRATVTKTEAVVIKSEATYDSDIERYEAEEDSSLVVPGDSTVTFSGLEDSSTVSVPANLLSTAQSVSVWPSAGDITVGGGELGQLAQKPQPGPSSGEQQAPQKRVWPKKKKILQYRCTTCRKAFYRASQLACHIGCHYPFLKQFQCKKCGKEYGYRAKLRTHLMKVHNIHGSEIDDNIVQKFNVVVDDYVQSFKKKTRDTRKTSGNPVLDFID